ncbi:MAG: hypothetical protein JEZ14_10835 [Marinilabiliaceae bacterium]|nr:hypothetical protein [Marinilabiliaceae bacterium]
MEGDIGFQQGTVERLTTYQTKHDEWQAQLSKLKHKFQLVSWVRLAVFIAAFSLPFILAEPWSGLFLIVFGVFITAFSILVKYALNLDYQKRYAQKRLNLIQTELNGLEDRWQDMPEGDEYIDADHDFVHDLDLFGKGSLFQFINRTATKRGERKLAEKLKSLALNRETILNKQAAISELAKAVDFRERFYALGAITEDENKKNREIKPEEIPDLRFITPFWKIIILAFPILFVASVIGALAELTSPSLITLLFLTGLGITGTHLAKVNAIHTKVSSLGDYIKRYSQLISLVEEMPFQAKILTDLRKRMACQDDLASLIVKKLGRLLNLLDQRMNMLLGIAFNGLFLWDLLICLGIRKWYSKYGSQLHQWFLVLEELESLNSLATFNYNYPHYALPTMDDNTVLEANALGHPLIPAEERISNDFFINHDKRIGVITGANMAGKSTFLRTVGVNLVLAGNGAAVTATSFKYRPMRFMTNMRAIDNLLKHESYFFSELKRLQAIVEELQKEGQLFFILDEILKGTNSHDKTTGSMALVKRLLELNGYGLVATHDLELGQLAKQYPGKVFNNCFEVTFNADDLQFDYKLREGITQSHNASFLMRKMKLIP